jgi:predicted DNA-binding protein YlxM (UPF0122 family)
MDIIEQKIEIMELYDLYQELLTQKQRDYLEAYYYEDESIGEIAEELDVSRNAVHDLIKRSVKKLYDYENGLKLREKRIFRNEIIEKIKQENDVDKIQELIAELEKGE